MHVPEPGTDEATVVVEASPEQVWALVSDPTKYGRFSPEAKTAWWRRPATGPAVGARFLGLNGHGVMHWVTRCTVTEVEEPKRFTFTVAESGMTWGYTLAPEGEGTRITQWRKQSVKVSPLIKLVQRSGILGTNREQLMVDGMHRTLGRIKTHLES